MRTRGAHLACIEITIVCGSPRTIGDNTETTASYTNARAVLANRSQCFGAHDVRTQRADRKTATSNLPRTTVSYMTSSLCSGHSIASRSRSIVLYLCVQLFYATRGGRAIQRSAGGRTTRTVASTLPTSARCGCHRYLCSPIRPFVWRWEGLTLMPPQTPSQNPRLRYRRPHALGRGGWALQSSV